MAMLLFVNLYCATAVLVVRKDPEPGDIEMVEMMMGQRALEMLQSGPQQEVLMDTKIVPAVRSATVSDYLAGFTAAAAVSAEGGTAQRV